MKLESKKPQLLLLYLFVVIGINLHPAQLLASADTAPMPDSGDTAWMLLSSALVFFMIPGLALFYGGMVRRKNVLSSMMHSLAATGIISLQWMIIGYSLAFGTDHFHIIGGLDKMFLSGISVDSLVGTIPEIVFVMFQGMFAIITPALISGSIAGRVRFSAYLVFILLWTTFVYDPLCHWVWGDGGWLLQLDALDFAGGTVVHISAGVSALVLIKIIGNRLGFPKERMAPHNLTMTLLGAGILWFGWFGFNAGSALSSGRSAGMAMYVTHLAAAAGVVGWMGTEWIKMGKPSALGVASGMVAGLVAITPAAGFVTPLWALIMGLVSGWLCYMGVLIKSKLGYDDSLDAFGVHGIGGIWGALATGVFATIGASSLITGNFHQLMVQFISVIATIAYAVAGTFIIGKLVDSTIGFRVSSDEEIEGLDQTQHGEVGYDF